MAGSAAQGLMRQRTSGEDRVSAYCLIWPGSAGRAGVIGVEDVGGAFLLEENHKVSAA